MDALLSLLIVIVLAYAFGEVAKHFSIPRVVGQVFAGMIIGIPFVKEQMMSGRNGELIAFLADLGILLLFFFVGLQIDLVSFRKYFKESAMISICNTFLPLIAGFVIFYLLGYGVVASAIIGICLAVSSQAVSVSVLEEFRMMKTTLGRMVMTESTVHDVLELGLISVVMTLIHATIGQETTASVLMDIALFLAAIIAFRYLIIPVLMHLFAKDKSITHLFTGAVVITLVLALVTLYLGLGSIVGALFAGIIVREVLLTGKKRPWEEHNIANAIHIVSFGFLVPVFFVWVGINTDITAIILHWKLVLILTIIAITGTVLGSIIGILARKGSWKEGMLIGWGVTPKGDVELVIATLALGSALITQEIYSALIMMAMITTLVAPIFFRHFVKKYSKRA
jgi:Kef-type K+ transport system membrane component KefB